MLRLKKLGRYINNRNIENSVTKNKRIAIFVEVKMFCLNSLKRK